MQKKEASDFLNKSLQEQLAQLVESKAAGEKKLRTELEEKFRKEKTDLETAFRKEKTELDEKNKKHIVDTELRNTKDRVETEEKFKKEKLKLTQDLEKLKKDFDTAKAESLKSDTARKEEYGRAQNRIKQLEGEYVSFKSECQKTIEGLNARIAELTSETSTAKDDQHKLRLLTEELTNLQAKHELVMQENEVARSNYERNLKGVTEKDDALKKMKLAKDELAASERALKGTATRLEKEKEALSNEIAALKSQIETQMSLIQSARQETDSELQKSAHRIKDMESELNGLRNEKEQLTKKLEESEQEWSVSSKKSAQL
ncbi:hypothetical protein HDU91_003312, partial [Kappamyces sp. JEL0680]